MKKQDYLLMHKLENKYWFWLGKKDLINKILKKYKQDKKIKILDIGCGTGSILESLKGKGDLYGIDPSSDAINYCKTKGNFKLKKSNIESLNYPNNYFDVIILSDIIEHIDDDSKGIQNCYKILKKKGILIITVPAHKKLWNQDDIRLSHKRRYSKERLQKISKNFKILKVSYIHFFIYPLVKLSRILESSKRNNQNSTLEMKMKDKLLKGDLIASLSNIILLYLNKIENSLLQIINLPFGVGLLMILEKGEKIED